jgi:hypothetical protein
MATAVKTLKATGFVDESGRLHLDDPLDTPSGRVRVSVLIEYDEPVDDGRITSIAQVCDFFRKQGQTPRCGSRDSSRR